MLQTVPDLKSDIPARAPQVDAGQESALLLDMDGGSAGDAEPCRDGFAGEISAARALADRRLWRFSLVIALILHGALFYALVSPGTRTIGGAGGRELDAISVTLISSEVLEALKPKAKSTDAGAAPAALRQGGPASKASSASSLTGKASAERPSPAKSKAKAEDKPKPQPVPAEPFRAEPARTKPDVHDASTKRKDDADKTAAKKIPREVVSDKPPVLTTVKPAELKTSVTSAVTPDRKTTAQEKKIVSVQPPPEPDKRLGETAAVKPPAAQKPNATPDQIQKDKPSATRKATAAAAAATAASIATSGGATSRARKSRARQAPGPAAATPGEKNSFAHKVVKSLRRGIPPIRHKRGRKRTVIVRFALDNSGSIRYVKVAKSSGRKRLDRAIIEAVEEVDFPRPPKSMTLNDLIYRMPFHFN